MTTYTNMRKHIIKQKQTTKNLDENEGDTLPDLNTMDDNGPPLMEGSQGFDMNKFQQPPGNYFLFVT